MTPHEISEALKLRRKGVSDATIAAGIGTTRQHVHATLGPRKRIKVPRREKPHAVRISRADFAFALRAWRASRGLSQSRAGDLLQISLPCISSWESERVGCSLAPAILLLMKLLDEKENRT